MHDSQLIRRSIIMFVTDLIRDANISDTAQKWT